MTVLLLCCCAFGQTPVVLSPVPKLQFFDASGRPLASGCVFSFISGTTTPLATYTDSTGFSVNTNPLILDSGGFAGSGSSGMWLQAGQAYRLSVKSFGGTNCASGSTLYSVDGIGGGLTLLTSNVPYSPTPSFPIQAQNELFTILLTGDAVAQTLTAVGVLPPAFIVFQITQDSSGGNSFTWPSNVIGGAPIGTAANQVTTQEFVWNGSNATALGPAVIGNGPALSTGAIVAHDTITGTAFISFCANPATVGTFRLCSTDSIMFRNNGNSANQGISADTLDRGIWSFGGGMLMTGANPNLFFGGTTASFPRIKRTATALNVRLADDSADAPITAGAATFSGIVATQDVISSTSTNYAVGGLEVTPPSSPPAGQQKGYFKAGAGFCTKDSAGVEYCTQPAGSIQEMKLTTGLCTTDAASYHACSNTLTWPVPFADADYVVTCSGVVNISDGADDQIAVTANIGSYTASQVTVKTQTQRSAPAGQLDEIHCIGIHP